MWILILHILFGITFAFYFDKIRYKIFLPMSRGVFIVVIMFFMVFYMLVMDGTVLDANREYYMKQWYYSVLTNRRGEDSSGSIAFSLFIVAGIVFSITYPIKSKIQTMLAKRQKK